MASNPFEEPNPATNLFMHEPPPNAPPPPPSYGYSNPEPLPNPYGAGSYYQPPPPPPNGASYANTSYGNTGLSDDSLRQRSMQLDQREAHLNAREAELATREVRLGKTKPPNWPRWPKSIIYQDINAEIPENLRRTVRLAYYGWFATVWALIWNLVVMCGVLAVAGSVGDFILAIVYVLLWTPLSFLTFRCLYRGARRRKTAYYIFYLFFLFLAILGHILWAVGIKGSGMGGFLIMLDLFSHGKNKAKGTAGEEYTVAILCLISCFFWIASVFYFAHVWIQARKDYKSLGGQRQAQREAASEAGRQAAENPEAVASGAKYASNSL